MTTTSVGPRIAIVGIGLCYPDASTPDELWTNVLAGRQAFRRLPDERMSHADYFSPDPAAPDRFYATKAAVLRDYEFDRARHRVAGSTYRATDLTHWLALDVASRALADAGYPDGDGLPRRSTGVVVGNTLTGEFSRASTMRLRWPYVRRTVAAALAERGWDAGEAAAFLRDLEPRYKSPFAPVDEDTLAGGLSNTIAGRICNHFDLGGGGFTVDGACSSSLLSVVTAAKGLVEGDIDVALAGGVDLSIDPFEVVGFAKTGALATGRMKVYDADSNGFWPGEGCGVLVLMREADAVEQGRRCYASIAGWGVSSDGRGGITRPEASGHRLALSRAYRRAGYGVGQVSYFEGHGTGTAVGDATEIDALSSARREADPEAPPAALSTIKGNLGHTKAAAGVAGLIKATLAIHHQVIPPATGHDRPHPSLGGDPPALVVPDDASAWPADRPIRAGVSALGFGGIDTHVTLSQAADAARRSDVDTRTRSLVAGRQDAELLVVDGDDRDDLRARVEAVRRLAPRLSYAELADLGATLAGQLAGRPWRAAVAAADPERAETALTRLLERLDAGADQVVSAADGVFLGRGTTAARIAYLFPGQGSGRPGQGRLARRFPGAAVYPGAGATAAGDVTATEIAQPRIVAGSLTALRVLGFLGIRASVAVGHSLGELTALHWAGALGEAEVLRLATVRGRVMATTTSVEGAMASLGVDAETARRHAEPEGVVVAGRNGPAKTVVSGPTDAVERVCASVRAAGATATRLRVSHAFHSPLVEPAATALAERITDFDLTPLRRRILSTVTGEPLTPETDLRWLLPEQVRRPVLFHQAASAAAAEADLLVEVGPGRVLSGLLADIAPERPALAVDTDSGSLSSLLTVVAASFALGAPVTLDPLLAGRAVRPLSLEREPTFLTNPCELAPAGDQAGDPGATAGAPTAGTTDSGPAAQALPGGLAPASVAGPHDGRDGAEGGTLNGAPPASTLDLLRQQAAERVELPVETIGADTHPLDDLHLSSITVAQLVNDVTSQLGLPPLDASTSFATVRLGELAALVDDLAETGAQGDGGVGTEVAGVAPWVRPFRVADVEAPAPPAPPRSSRPVARWQVVAPPGHRLAEPVCAALEASGLGDGVLLCLPAEGGPAQLPRLLQAARAALAGAPDSRLVVVQHRLGAAGLGRTLHLEAGVPVTVVTLDGLAGDGLAGDDVARRVSAEAVATTGYHEVRYAADGARTVPVLRPLPASSDRSQGEPSSGGEPASSGEPDTAAAPLGPGDVLLVTGGGKGITAECALAIASDYGTSLALVGRADPAGDLELAENLARMTAAGARFRYERADVTDPEQVRRAVERVEADLGPVTGVLHGAGRNEPVALGSLTDEAFAAAVAPKVDGLRAVLDAVDTDRLSLLVTFGSIIGRAGLRGEAHYATANDWLTELTVDVGRRHPHVRVLALEWSVWSGAGMGERLGVVESLMRTGITPISTDEGIAVLRRVLADPDAGPVLVVSGRTGGLGTLTLASQELPLARFVDRVLVHYPGVELVTETELSVENDPYLADHELDGALLFPAVLGIEAMAQVARAVGGHDGIPVLEDVELLRPIAVPPDGATTLRIAALVRDADTVEVVLLSEETGFGADHFRAVLRYGGGVTRATGATGEALPAREPRPGDALPPVPVDPAAQLYGGVLFQGERFRRLLTYRRAAARHAVAELATATPLDWFSRFLPQDRVLADPGTRDAVMHALQCCVPDATLLPQRIDRLELADPATDDGDVVVMDGRERSREGDSYVYDVDVRTPAGELVERWEGLRLRAVRSRGGAGPWVPSLLGPHLERALEDVLGGSRAVVVEPDPADSGAESTAQHRVVTALAASRALDRPVELRYRSDGRPEADGLVVSAAHAAGLTLVVTGEGRLACDVEEVVERDPDTWRAILGPAAAAAFDRLLARTGESPELVGTRLWGAVECLRKTGTTATVLRVSQVRDDGWVVLSDGDAQIASWVTTVAERSNPLVVTVLSGERVPGPTSRSNGGPNDRATRRPVLQPVGKES